jgi:hypothetical protein
VGAPAAAAPSPAASRRGRVRPLRGWSAQSSFACVRSRAHRIGPAVSAPHPMHRPSHDAQRTTVAYDAHCAARKAHSPMQLGPCILNRKSQHACAARCTARNFMIACNTVARRTHDTPYVDTCARVATSRRHRTRGPSSSTQLPVLPAVPLQPPMPAQCRVLGSRARLADQCFVGCRRCSTPRARAAAR